MSEDSVDSVEVFAIDCSTGCSCCSDENHSRGFYQTREEVEARIKRFKSGVDNPVASQYARYGCYSIEKYDAEEIDKDRMIVDAHVFPKQFIKVNTVTGELIDCSYDDEVLIW